MRKYLPLFLVELYLILTLLVFYFGPVRFAVHNEFFFILFIFLYHVSFVVGYYLSARSFKFGLSQLKHERKDLIFYFSFLFGVLGILVSYKNLMVSSSLIPYSFLYDVKRGLLEPGVVYAERMNELAGGEVLGSRLFNVISILFSYFKLLFIFVSIYYWKYLSKTKKFISLFYFFLFLSPGIASGTNSIVFYFFIFFVSSLLVVLYVRDYKHFKGMFLVSVFVFLLPISFFGFIMSHRGGGFDYFATTSPLGDISVLIDTPKSDGLFSYLLYSFVWLNYYLVQGYYGFSLIFDLGFNWTYGFGNSAFLQRQLLVLTGIDISSITYQARISDIWDKDAQWHSFYGQVANDLSPPGVALLMFFLGFFLCRVWMSVVYRKSFYGAALLPIFILMFIFFPANNQVFGFIDTFSYFIFISFFWFLEGKKVGW